MKLSSRKQITSLADLPMTSMIDVVFLLLIFFMVTTSWVKTERELDPGIRVQKSASQRAARDLEPAVIDVLLRDTGPCYRIGGRDIASDQELQAVLVQFPNKQEGAVVRVSDAAPFGFAAAAIQACKAANFANVSYVPGGR
ncbi:MAG: hypothetical protein RIS70_2432 [Planctomycetota bacterium]|jgi:biopolymer transport protein ExbD